MALHRPLALTLTTLVIAAGVLALAAGLDDDSDARASTETWSLLYSVTGDDVVLGDGASSITVEVRRPDPDVIWFTDRPQRHSGSIPLDHFVETWSANGFDDDPPNAALVLRHGDGTQRTVVVTMQHPILDQGRLHFTATVLLDAEAAALEGGLERHADAHTTDVPETAKSVALFIDDVLRTGVVVDNCNLSPGAYCTESVPGAWQGADLSDLDLDGATLIADLTGVDLTNTVLNDSNLAGQVLHGADLSGAQVNGSDLRDADLTGTTLDRTLIENSDLTGADLTGTDLTGVDLTGSDLTDADLSGANLSGNALLRVVLTGADLTGTDLTGVDLAGRTDVGFGIWAAVTDTSTTCPNGSAGPCVISIGYCPIRPGSVCNQPGWAADLTGADLVEAPLAGSDLTGVTFDGADLSGADLSGALLQGTSFVGADLTGTDLTGTNLRDVDLRGANLTGALVPINVNAAVADRSTTCPNGSPGPCAVTIRGCTWRAGADCRFGTAGVIDMRGTDFSHADLRGITVCATAIQALDSQNYVDVLDLAGSTFVGADLRGSSWMAPILTDADFTDADLGWATVQAIGSGWVLDGANLTPAPEFPYRLQSGARSAVGVIDNDGSSRPDYWTFCLG